MFRILIILTPVFFAQSIVWADSNDMVKRLPDDVRQFIERRDTCDHFRGEITGDHSERGHEVNEKLEKWCKGTGRDLLMVRLSRKEWICGGFYNF